MHAVDSCGSYVYSWRVGLCKSWCCACGCAITEVPVVQHPQKEDKMIQGLHSSLIVQEGVSREHLLQLVQCYSVSSYAVWAA